MPRSRHPPQADTPLEQSPPGAAPGSRHPPSRSRHPPEQTPPIQEQTRPRADTPYPQEQTPPGTPPQSRHPPGADTTWEQTPLPLGSSLQHTVNERPVRILLECILVLRGLTTGKLYTKSCFDHSQMIHLRRKTKMSRCEEFHFSDSLH